MALSEVQDFTPIEGNLCYSSGLNRMPESANPDISAALRGPIVAENLILRARAVLTFASTVELDDGIKGCEQRHSTGFRADPACFDGLMGSASKFYMNTGSASKKQ